MAHRIDDQQLSLARVYAEALFALAEEAGQAEEVLTELEALVGLEEESPDLAAFLTSPLVDANQRRETLDKALLGRANDLAVNTLQVMNAKGRMELLPALAAAYRAVLDERRGRVDVSVTTAVELAPEQREKLKATLARVTRREVRLAETVDPETLGGLIVSVGDHKIDYSLASDLRQLDHALRDRATREIHGATE